jgi:hypothetical protein
MSRNKIVIVIEGGVCTGVLADDPDAEIEIVDMDNAEADGERAEKEKYLDDLTSSMVGVF